MSTPIPTQRWVSERRAVTVRVGVVGTGFGSRVVAPAFAETRGCEVIDVVSARDHAGVAALCERADLDLVSVHAPPFLHGTYVRRALASGHAVLCDKPFGVNALEAETMLAAAEAAECVHLLNFEFRYDPLRVTMRTLIADGAIGTPEHVSWTQFSSGSRVPLRRYGWLFDRTQGGGWIGAWGSHAVDALRFLVGDIAAAHADCRTTISERPDHKGVLQTCDAEDGFTAELAFVSGATGMIDTSFAAPVSLASRIVVSGSDGVLECVGDARATLRRTDGTREEHSTVPPEGDPHVAPMRRFTTVVRDAVEEGVAPPDAPTFVDGLACAKVLDALRGR
jgi:predicted dehydrogenase